MLFSKCDRFQLSSEDSSKFTKFGMPSQLKSAGSSAEGRCHETCYFKSSSSVLHTLWTRSRQGEMGAEKVNLPHFLVDNKHSQIQPVKAISASPNDSLVAIHKMWNFTSGEGVSLVNRLEEHSFVFFLHIYFYLFYALNLLSHHGSTSLHQAERFRLKKQ